MKTAVKLSLKYIAEKDRVVMALCLDEEAIASFLSD